LCDRDEIICRDGRAPRRGIMVDFVSQLLVYKVLP
jgi:hypothetical protein